jgi:putative transposase
MVVFLIGLGHFINRKRIQRLMSFLGVAGMAPGPNTIRPHPEHKIYPYLLRGVPAVRPNQVWSTDITYVRLERGFMYLTAIIDWYSRKVLAWRLSNNRIRNSQLRGLSWQLLTYRLWGGTIYFNIIESIRYFKIDQNSDAVTCSGNTNIQFCSRFIF